MFYSRLAHRWVDSYASGHKRMLAPQSSRLGLKSNSISCLPLGHDTLLSAVCDQRLQTHVPVQLTAITAFTGDILGASTSTLQAYFELRLSSSPENCSNSLLRASPSSTSCRFLDCTANSAGVRPNDAMLHRPPWLSTVQS
jgi:hypothetical protein